MPSEFIQHTFAGGWARDLGPTTDVAPDRDAFVEIPFLWIADNVLYELDGGPHTVPGTSKINSSALQSGAAIRGCFDYWSIGTSGSPAQHRIVYVDTTVKSDDANGTFTDRFTGLVANAVPSFSTFDDILIIAYDSSDTPDSWDGSTAQTLAGSPPNFSFSVTHQNRQWAAGVASTPSRLYYSASVNPEDWSGGGSGNIDIDPSDGDSITGLISHKNELWIFKGPHKGSIHRITGSAPTGDDAFARKTFIEGVGSVNHNGIFRFKDDIGFVSPDGSIRSLSVTSEFGDLREAALSWPIDSYLAEELKHDTLKECWAVSDTHRTYIAVPVQESSTNNQVLVMDYRFNPVRWSALPAFGAAFGPTSMMFGTDPGNNNDHRIFFGGDDGFLRRSGVTVFSIDGSTNIPFKVVTPYLNYRISKQLKTIEDISLGINPANEDDITVGYIRDGEAEQTVTITQTGAAVLGSFTLGSSKLGGGRFVDIFNNTTDGEFRAIQYRVQTGTLNEELELHTIGSTIVSGDFATEN